MRSAMPLHQRRQRERATAPAAPAACGAALKRSRPRAGRVDGDAKTASADGDEHRQHRQHQRELVAVAEEIGELQRGQQRHEQRHQVACRGRPRTQPSRESADERDRTCRRGAHSTAGAIAGVDAIKARWRGPLTERRASAPPPPAGPARSASAACRASRPASSRTARRRRRSCACATSGCFDRRRHSCWRRATTASGVPLGARKPFQPCNSRFGKPSSRTVGTFGSAADLVATASALSWPERTCCERARKLVAAELDAARQQVGHQRRRAAERHVVHLDAGVALQHLAASDA